MAKGPAIDTITAGFVSAAKLNSNFAALVAAFENFLALDGTTPNAMLADFDLNGNDILNGGDAAFTDITIGGTSLAAQVTAAAASATAAATSATNAGTSETNAAASFDSFDDIYLGAKASDPTLDNDGNALATGALYFNTTSNEMKVYDGASWGALTSISTFLGLSDTPASLSGEALKVVRVNAGETALEFVTISTSEPSDGDKGDITVTASGLTWNIDAGAVDATALATDAVETVKILNANVTTAKIADDNVTYAKIQNVVADNVVLGNIAGAGGIVAELTGTQLTVLIDDFTDALSGGVPASGGGTTKFLRADQTWVVPPDTTGGITAGTAQATTSGSTKSYTGLAAGLNEITVLLSGVQASGTERILIQLGDSGGFEVTNYDSNALSDGGSNQAETTGFTVTSNSASSNAWTGRYVLSRITGNKWVGNGVVSDKPTNNSIEVGAGEKELSAELTQIRISVGGDTFSAGTVNVFTQ